MTTETLYPVKIDATIYETDRPSLSGKDLLELAGKVPVGDYIIYLILEDGDMEGIRSSEVVDLQRSGIEAFRTFKSDVIYRLEVDGKSREWGSDLISGRAIKRLADIENPASVGIWQIIAGTEGKLIADRDLANLSCNGIERFRLGAKYSVCIEGQVFEWMHNSITTEEIIRLGGWEASKGAVEVDKDQNERTLTSGEVIHLKPGHNFCKKQHFRRGFEPDSRIGEELTLLRKNFNSVEYKEEGNLHWFKINDYRLSEPLTPELTSVVFSVTLGHPVPKPYGFYVLAGIRLNEQLLNLNEPQNPPPFDGFWRFVSWDAENWLPGANVTSGDNLWGWARSFRNRLLEGE